MDGVELIPPHSIEAEQAVLGAILVEGEIPPGIEEMVSPEDFYIPNHRDLYAAMLSLKAKGMAIDLTTLSEEMKVRGCYERCGGKEYLVNLTSQVPTTANAEHYAKIVRNRARVRRVIEAAKIIASKAYESTGDEQDFFDEIERTMLAATRDPRGAGYISLKDSVIEFLQLLSNVIKNDPLPGQGIPTGFRELDNLLGGGLHQGDLIILAARPAMGKTSFALNIAEHVALQHGIPVLIFSLEMGVEQLTQRLLASVARVNNLKLRNLTKLRYDPDVQNIVNSLFDSYQTLSASPIYMDDTPGITVQALRSRVRQWTSDRTVFPDPEAPKTGLIIVDYLQLMRAPSTSRGTREQEVSEISRALKALAREMNMPVLALSQLNRRVEERDDKRPMLSDLRESGAIEQDADVILFIHRPEVYKKKDSVPDEEKGRAEIIVAKHRHGPTGEVILHFAKEFTRFQDMVDPSLMAGMETEEAVVEEMPHDEEPPPYEPGVVEGYGEEPYEGGDPDDPFN